MSAANDITGGVLSFLGFGLVVVVGGLAKALGAGYSEIQMTAAMYIFGFIALLPFIRSKHLYVHPAARGDMLRLCMVSLVTSISFITAPALMPLTDFISLLLLTPLIITALSKPLLNEPVNRSQWGCVVLGLTGALCIVQPTAQVLNTGAIAALCAALFLAMEGIYFRKLADTNSTTINFYFMLSGVVLFVPLTFFAYQAPSTHMDYGLFIGLGVITALSMQMLIVSARFLPAVVLAPFRYTKLLWSVLLGYIIWQEVPSYLSVLGMVLIVISGMALLVFSNRKAV